MAIGLHMIDGPGGTTVAGSAQADATEAAGFGGFFFFTGPD